MEGVGVILRFAIIDAEVKGIWDKDEPKDSYDKLLLNTHTEMYFWCFKG